MKIISWNCNGAFRKKAPIILDEKADIYVIQECENPQKYPKEFANLHLNYQWVGENDNRGLGIFARPEIDIRLNDWPVYCLRHFVSVRINDAFDLLGIWASPPYIEEYYIYQCINFNNYNENTIIIGDFNSNAKWDNQHGKRNHSTVVEELKTKHLISAYHYQSGEQPGSETQPTFFLHKNLDKKHHIDYCFIHPSRLADFRILDAATWLPYSDHTPIQVILNNA